MRSGIESVKKKLRSPLPSHCSSSHAHRSSSSSQLGSPDFLNYRTTSFIGERLAYKHLEKIPFRKGAVAILTQQWFCLASAYLGFPTGNRLQGSSEGKVAVSRRQEVSCAAGSLSCSAVNHPASVPHLLEQLICSCVLVPQWLASALRPIPGSQPVFIMLRTSGQ